MKSRHFLSLIVLAVSGFVTVNFLQLTKAENSKPNETLSTTEQISTNNSVGLIETKELTEAQKAIPDEVAFEVFLRTIGENNARQLLLKAGFDEAQDSDKLDQIMNDAKMLADSLDSLDKKVRDIKLRKGGGRDFQADAKIKSDLSRLQSDKADILRQTISYYLKTATRFDNGWDKVQNYVQTTVKSKMQVVETKSSLRSKPQKKEMAKVGFANNFAVGTAAQTQVGNAYLYCDGWSEGENVFGSGMITEGYASGTSYLVSVTVTSPSGRTNTTSGGWDYATLSSIAGLSRGFEDGTYNIQANFDGDLGGYYDEWGNYFSYGTYFIGSESSSVIIAPSVRITQMQPPTVTLPSLGQQLFNVTVAVSSEVQPGTRVGVEFVENMVTPPTPRPRASVDDNSKTIVINAGSQAVFVPFTVTVDSNSPSGSITYRASITSVTAPPGTPAATGSGTSDATINIVSNTPTPSPTPTGGGGCGSCGYAGLGCAGCANYGAYGYTNNGCPPPFFNHFGCCCQGSPIVIDIDGNGFAMTNGANGVSFDLGGDGMLDRTSWTTANSDDAWLVLDRNQNHRIDDGKEMFGNYCDQPAPPPGVLRNGFIGLAEFDKAANGGNGDGKITRSDTVFRKLRLWQDRNHNGISEPEEVSKLPALDVVALFLDYSKSRRTDEFGNRFKYRARIRDRNGARVGRWAWDVFTVPAQ